MASTVDKDSANWRLFGGGGLLLGGVLWLIASILFFNATGDVARWLAIVGIVVIGVALFFVAFGQTGSNGAVGKSVFGKVALVVFGVGWILYAVSPLLGGVTAVASIAAVLIVVGGVLSAYAIWQRRVARAAARWILWVPVVLSILLVLSVYIAGFPGGAWLPVLTAAGFVVTGVLYLLNRRDIG